MNQYETVFILTPVLSEAQMKEAVKDYEKFIKADGGKIVSTEDWGLRKSNGFYNLFEFQANPSLIADLELKFKRDERVIRFLTVKMDKYHVEYAERRRNKRKEVKA
jgi:small subunit ribosomal protein S6